jgi:hypothetical protein
VPVPRHLVVLVAVVRGEPTPSVVDPPPPGAGFRPRGKLERLTDESQCVVKTYVVLVGSGSAGHHPDPDLRITYIEILP